jgi:hypothetical protein
MKQQPFQFGQGSLFGLMAIVAVAAWGVSSIPEEHERGAMALAWLFGPWLVLFAVGWVYERYRVA